MASEKMEKRGKRSEGKEFWHGGEGGRREREEMWWHPAATAGPIEQLGERGGGKPSSSTCPPLLWSSPLNGRGESLILANGGEEKEKKRPLSSPSSFHHLLSFLPPCADLGAIHFYLVAVSWHQEEGGGGRKKPFLLSQLLSPLPRKASSHFDFFQ